MFYSENGKIQKNVKDDVLGDSDLLVEYVEKQI